MDTTKTQLDVEVALLTMVGTVRTMQERIETLEEHLAALKSYVEYVSTIGVVDDTPGPTFIIHPEGSA